MLRVHAKRSLPTHVGWGRTRGGRWVVLAHGDSWDAAWDRLLAHPEASRYDEKVVLAREGSPETRRKHR